MANKRRGNLTGCYCISRKQPTLGTQENPEEPHVRRPDGYTVQQACYAFRRSFSLLNGLNMALTEIRHKPILKSQLCLRRQTLGPYIFGMLARDTSDLDRWRDS
jgi:hypothetical protein